jgi:paraquat-inducible protein B
MSQKANPTLIGVFVFGAILIAVGAVVFFGSADLFARKRTFVSYFTQSVSGLQAGSNVKFKGVDIGKVTRVLIGLAGGGQPAYAKVFYEIDQNAIVRDVGKEEASNIDVFSDERIKRRIEEGLRARLDFESLISGQLFVSLDFFKDAAPFTFHHNPSDRPAFEIPVQPSDIDAILGNLTKAIGNLGNVDFLALSKDLQSLLISAREGIESLKLAQIGQSVNDLVTGPELKGALTSVKVAFDQLDVTVKKLDSELGPIKANLDPTLEEAKKTMTQLDAATHQLDRMMNSNSGFRYQLDSTLAQIGSAADALQRLSEFLERNPNSIIFGRRPAKSQ